MVWAKWVGGALWVCWYGGALMVMVLGWLALSVGGIVWWVLA